MIKQVVIQNVGLSRGGVRNARDAADTYFKAVQEERVVRREPSERFNAVQEQMAESRRNYEVLNELLKDKDFRRLTGKVLEMKMRLKKSTAT